MQRIVVISDTQDVKSWQISLAYAEKIVEQSAKPTNIVLLVHTKREIDKTFLAHHIGVSDAKDLSSGRPIQLQSGSKLSLSTLETIDQTFNGEVIIAFFADKTLLDVVDLLVGSPGIVAVPVFLHECDYWVDHWNPTIHEEY